MKTIRLAYVIPPEVYGQAYSSEANIWQAVGMSQTTSSGFADNTLYVYPILVTRPTRVDSMALTVTVIGDVGSLIRLGIFRDNNTQYPGALLIDLGTVAGDVVATPEITFDTILAAGIYWLAAAIQSAPIARPTLRVVNEAQTQTGGSASTTVIPLVARGYSQSGVTGALPTTFTTTPTPTNLMPRVAMHNV